MYLFESWQSWQCTQVVQSSAVKSLSAGRRHCLYKLLTYVNNWVRGSAHSHHRHPLSLFWAPAVRPHWLAAAICWTTFMSLLPHLRTWSLPKTNAEARWRWFLFYLWELDSTCSHDNELIQTLISKLWELIMIELQNNVLPAWRKWL